MTLGVYHVVCFERYVGKTLGVFFFHFVYGKEKNLEMTKSVISNIFDRSQSYLLSAGEKEKMKMQDMAEKMMRLEIDLFKNEPKWCISVLIHWVAMADELGIHFSRQGKHGEFA